MYGLQMKLIGRTDTEVLEGMFIIAVVTYTLPDFFLPYLTKFFSSYSFIKNSYYSKIVISSVILFFLILFETIIIKNYIHTSHIEQNGKRLF